jgi:hypothetical protein
MSTGEILDTAFGVYRRHFATLVTIVVLLIGVALVLFGALAALVIPGVTLGETGIFFGLMVLFLLGYVVLTQLSMGASVLVIADGYLGRTLRAGEAIRRTFSRLGLLVTTGLMVGLVVGLGLLLLVVPGVILLCGLVLITQVVMLESPAGATAALSRTWALTRDFRWRMFLLMLVAFVLTIVVLVGINLIAAMVVGSAAVLESGEGGPGTLVPYLLVQAAQLVANIVITPLPYCILTVAYYDLRVRKEAFDLELLAASMQPA